MNDKRLNRFLTLAIVALSVMIVVLAALIIQKGSVTLANSKEPMPLPMSSNGVVFASEQEMIDEQVAMEEAQTEVMLGAVISANTGVNIRTLPSKEGDIVLSASPGQYVQVTKLRDDGWSFIMYGSRGGYISDDFLVYGIIVRSTSGRTEFTEMPLDDAVVEYFRANPDAPSDIFSDVPEDEEGNEEDNGE